MPFIDLSILNQKQTPAFYADVFANRPAAGFVGRIFVSTDTYAFYRDNGTGWDLIGGPGTGTVTGTGTNGQVTFWNGASTITGSNDLFWDATNGHLGVNTNAPGTALDVHHDQSTVAILNQTTATNDVRIGFQNNGVGLWRIGAFYNAGANDFGIFDAVGNIQPITVKKTTGQVLIGTSTVGSGKLVVASASSDNGIQIVGATAPSLRIDSAESGPTKRAGLGISTATNNFIQGSADRDFCIFNGSTAAASPILFGIYDAGAVNVQEAARISPARNFLLGTTTDAGQKLQVSGTALISGNSTFNAGLNVLGNLYAQNSNGNIRLKGQLDGFLGCGASNNNLFLMDWATATKGLTIDLSTGAATFSSSVGINGSPGTSFPLEAYINSSTAYTTSSRGNVFRVFNSNTSSDIFAGIELGGSGPANDGLAGLNGVLTSTGSAALTFYTRNANTFAEKMRISADGNVGISTTSPDQKLTIQAAGTANGLISFKSAAGTTTSYIGVPNANGDVITTSTTLDLCLRNDTGSILFGYSNSEKMRMVGSTGNLLIGTTTDNGYKLQVSGNAILSNSGAAIAMDGRGSGNSGAKVQLLGWAGVLNNWEISTALYTGGGLDLAVSTTGGGSTFTTAIGTFNQTTGAYTALSDINKKKNFEPSNLGLEAVLKLKPTLYNMKSQNDNEPKELGFIAQEVKEAISQAYVENGSFIGINERAILATVVKAIQELNTKIENLK